MADNRDTQSATLATLASGNKIALYEIATFSGDANALAAPAVLTVVSGAEGSRAITELTGDGTNGLDVDVTRSVLPTGASTSALQDAGNTLLDSINTKTPALSGGRVPVDGSGVTQPVSGPLTDTQLRASAVPISGALTDTQLRASAVPVSGPLTDTQLRATAVPVSGPLTDTQLRASAVPISGALTDAQLRATAVPISGALTDAQLRATAIPIVESSTVLTGAAAQTAVVNNILPASSGAASTACADLRSASVQVNSTGTAGTFIFEQSNDDVNFFPLPVFNGALTTGVPIVAAITATAANILYSFPLRARFVRLRIATTITGGSIQAFSRFSTEPWTPTAQLVSNPTAANLNVTVGSISTSITPGTAAANLGKAEDAVAASGDVGVMALAVRIDTAATQSSASGDYHPLLVDANGRLHASLSANIRSSWATKSTVTITLASLASAAARESTVVDFTASGAVDAFFRLVTRASAASTGTVSVFCYAALGDTTYTDGATGTDAAFTAANRLNARLLTLVQLNGTTSVTAGPVAIAQLFGGVLPSKVGFIVVNNAAVALDATGGNHVAEVQTVVRAA